jgi:hypothetical protein
MYRVRNIKHGCHVYSSISRTLGICWYFHSRYVVFVYFVKNATNSWMSSRVYTLVLTPQCSSSVRLHLHSSRYNGLMGLFPFVLSLHTCHRWLYGSISTAFARTVSSLVSNTRRHHPCSLLTCRCQTRTLKGLHPFGVLVSNTLLPFDLSVSNTRSQGFIPFWRLGVKHALHLHRSRYC